MSQILVNCAFQLISSTERQKGLTTRRFNIQLQPCVSELKICVTLSRIEEIVTMKMPRDFGQFLQYIPAQLTYYIHIRNWHNLYTSMGIMSTNNKAHGDILNLRKHFGRSIIEYRREKQESPRMVNWDTMIIMPYCPTNWCFIP